MLKKQIEQIMQDIKDHIDDNETVHNYFDDAMRLIAEKAHPELVQKLDELVKDIYFWYA